MPRKVLGADITRCLHEGCEYERTSPVGGREGREGKGADSPHRHHPPLCGQAGHSLSTRLQWLKLKHQLQQRDLSWLLCGASHWSLQRLRPLLLSHRLEEKTGTWTSEGSCPGPHRQRGGLNVGPGHLVSALVPTGPTSGVLVQNVSVPPPPPRVPRSVLFLLF